MKTLLDAVGQQHSVISNHSSRWYSMGFSVMLWGAEWWYLPNTGALTEHHCCRLPNLCDWKIGMILLKNRKEIAFPIGVCSKIIQKNRWFLSKPIDTSWDRMVKIQFFPPNSEWLESLLLNKHGNKKYIHVVNLNDESRTSCLLKLYSRSLWCP